MGSIENYKAFHAARQHCITIWWSRQPFLGASSRTISIPQTKQLSQEAARCCKKAMPKAVPNPTSSASHISSYLLTTSHRNPALLEPGSRACFQTGSAPWCCPCLNSKACTNLSIQSHMQSMQIPSCGVPFQNHHDSWNKWCLPPQQPLALSFGSRWLATEMIASNFMSVEMVLVLARPNWTQNNMLKRLMIALVYRRACLSNYSNYSFR